MTSIDFKSNAARNELVGKRPKTVIVLLVEDDVDAANEIVSELDARGCELLYRDDGMEGQEAVCN